MGARSSDLTVRGIASHSPSERQEHAPAVCVCVCVQMAVDLTKVCTSSQDQRIALDRLRRTRNPPLSPSSAESVGDTRSVGPVGKR
jgi:hypothetical protein